ncbi:MAG: hypothetical protein KTR25_05450 [Myxococcales bacterium]|nr:hypothetical protein [Myxococcales bacterium]
MHRIDQTVLTLMIIFALPNSGWAARPPDVAVQILGPGAVRVDTPGHYEVVVENVSSRAARGLRLQLGFSVTATSPEQYILGAVSNQDYRCFDDGHVFECVLGRLGRGQTTRVSFDFSAPYSAVMSRIRAVASVSGDSNLSNNEASVPVDLVYYSQVVVAPVDGTVTLCTGKGLISFYDCVVSPSSTSSYPLTLEAGGTIAFPGNSVATGRWNQVSPEDLHLEYEARGHTVMRFDGKGIGNQCFDGIAAFSGSANAAYRVCL